MSRANQPGVLVLAVSLHLSALSHPRSGCRKASPMAGVPSCRAAFAPSWEL